MGKVLLMVALFGLLAGALYVMVAGWNLEGDVEMSAHGYVAMALGILFSLLIGAGLMGLVFYSHRRGYDEPPYQP